MTYPQIPGTRVIGFGGAPRAGKDTACTVLFGVDPLRSARFAFSDAIAAHCRVMRGMTKRDPVLLQHEGFALRSARQTVWIDALYWRIDEVRPRLALISGVRFPDEIQMVRDMGGHLFWIDRVDEHGNRHVVTDRDPNFVTETSVTASMFDAVITNVEGRDELFRMRVLDAYRRL